MMLQRIQLDQGWEFRQSSSLNNGTATSFLPVAQFPTVSYIDLLHHRLIPDPYIDMNELQCLWVNDADWTYRTQKVGPIHIQEGERAALVFEGLDTVVDVYLDEKHILFSKNMHISNRVDVTNLLRDREEPSILELRFRAAPQFSRDERSRIGYKGREKDIFFGGSERLFLRKAQYQWGWDWGPAINTAGPWKPIYLEKFCSRIEELLITQNVAPDLLSASITVKGSVENPKEGQEVIITINGPTGAVLQLERVKLSETTFEKTVEIEQPELWYPWTYGSQPLYTVTVSLAELDTKSKTIGLRRLRLLQHHLEKAEGTAFLFEINDVRTFCGGSCWIPADFMLPRISRKRYNDWISLAKSGNQTMIRVWGGGIVESDEFYNACDREGILVWQDFLYACGNYPASSDFIDNVRSEAEQQVKRVGHHPSLAIWAGNNEDYMLADILDWGMDWKDEKGPWDKTNFPARDIYERVLPDVVERLGGDVPYWRSSPYGGKFANDTTVGDTHIWDVWHGPMSPYQDYKKYTSRFVTEFGFESAPNIRTLHKAITNPKERHSQSRTFDAHDKGPGHERRYPMYLGENFRFRMNPLRDFIYSTQLLQAEAMSYAYNLWRREFRGPGEENCSGVLVWQLNDLWPGTSWALVDVDLHRKPAFFITKRALAPFVVGMERLVTEEPPYIVMSYKARKARVDVWAVNGTLSAMEGALTLKAFDIETGEELPLPESQRKDVTLKPNQSTEIATLDIPKPETTVLVAYLNAAFDGKLLARWVSWPEPLKYVQFHPQLKVEVRVESSEHGESVVLSSNAPAKGVVISVPPEEGEEVELDDNFVDLVPGEQVSLKVIGGLRGRKLVARWLCDWETTEEFEL